MTINEIQDGLIEEFSMLTDWVERYEYLIQLGKDLPPIEPQYKTDDHLIKGCQSKVWLHAELKEDGKIYFTADSDAIISKGLVSLVIRILSGHTPDEIANAELYCIDRIGLKEHLSPTRSNGLVSMIKQMKLYAIAFQAQVKNA
jgi:cysteine desulfuration protein SufE